MTTNINVKKVKIYIAISKVSKIEYRNFFYVNPILTGVVKSLYRLGGGSISEV